jgi:hypothetical protein
MPRKKCKKCCSCYRRKCRKTSNNNNNSTTDNGLLLNSLNRFYVYDINSADNLAKTLYTSTINNSPNISVLGCWLQDSPFIQLAMGTPYPATSIEISQNAQTSNNLYKDNIISSTALYYVTTFGTSVLSIVYNDASNNKISISGEDSESGSIISVAAGVSHNISIKYNNITRLFIIGKLGIIHKTTIPPNIAAGNLRTGKIDPPATIKLVQTTNWPDSSANSWSPETPGSIYIRQPFKQYDNDHQLVTVNQVLSDGSGGAIEVHSHPVGLLYLPIYINNNNNNFTFLRSENNDYNVPYLTLDPSGKYVAAYQYPQYYYAESTSSRFIVFGAPLIAEEETLIPAASYSNIAFNEMSLLTPVNNTTFDVN